MDTKQKANEWYYTTGLNHYCCDEFQFVYYCEKHDEPQGCYYCDFDYTKPCECEGKI